METTETKTKPWENENDLGFWQDEATGYLCVIRRNHFGALCGYVGVPADHPAHRECYQDVWSEDHPDALGVGNLDVHGGVTFTDFAYWPEGVDDGRWYVGFDCAHSGDYCPGMPGAFRDGSYKNWAYAEDNCRQLAAQLKDLETKGATNDDNSTK